MFNKVFKISVVFLVSFIFSGCFFDKEKKKIVNEVKSSQSFPNWFENPKRSDNYNFYGVGEGDVRREAISMALSQIAGEISVTISSTFESESSYSQNGKGTDFSKDAKNQVKSVINAVNFNNAIVENEAKVGEKFLTLVRVNRADFYQTQLAEFQQMESQLNSLYNFSLQKGGFDILSNMKELKEMISKTTAKASLLHSINRDFDFSAKNREFSEMNSILSDRARNLQIFVKDNSGFGFDKTLKKALTQDGYKLVSYQKGGRDLISIFIDIVHQPVEIKTTNVKLKDLSFANIQITISTKDSFGNGVAKNILNYRSSGNSYNEAIKNQSKFERTLSENGAFKVLKGI
jgi:hypothetical protein